MKRWEYLVGHRAQESWEAVTWDENHRSTSIPQLPPEMLSSLRDWLATCGDEGWELVQVEPAKGVNWRGYSYIFKREMGDGEVRHGEG